jgi:hypothetical protein
VPHLPLLILAPMPPGGEGIKGRCMLAEKGYPSPFGTTLALRERAG